MAQQRIPIDLGAPTDVARTRFTQIISIRELSDGTVLVADRSEGRLVHLRWDESSSPTVITRHGDGPGDIRGVGWLYPLRGDSTLFTDSYNSRWNLMHGAEIVGSLFEHRPINRLLGARLSGTDRSGHVLGRHGLLLSGQSRRNGAADSLLLLLVDRSSDRVDTIARLKGRGRGGFTQLPASRGRPRMLIGGNPLDSEDQALLFLDGWIAVARTDPYRVDWRRPDGEWVAGAPLPFEVIEVDDREKCAAQVRYLGEMRCDPSILPGWPGFVPAFLPRERIPTLFASPDGSLVITRSPTADHPERRYDAVDRSGRLTGVVSLPERYMIIGFGASSVYLVSEDDLGLQTLGRYPWLLPVLGR